MSKRHQGLRRALLAAAAGALVAGDGQAIAPPSGPPVEPGPANGDAMIHTNESFSFTMQASPERAFPLFGALGERAWAPEWSPEVLWPLPPADREGMVFLVAHGSRTATWINSRFDPAAHRAQYVYVVPDVVATVIDVELAAQGTATQVRVRYARTALSADAGEIVARMATHDRAAAREWSDQIARYLARRP